MFNVFAEPGQLHERYLGVKGLIGKTQHAFLPLSTWHQRFEMVFRLRPTGMRNPRAGVEVEEARGRKRYAFTYNALQKTLDVNIALGPIPGRSKKHVQLKRASLDLKPALWSKWKLSVDGPRFTLSVNGTKMVSLTLQDFEGVKSVNLLTSVVDAVHFDDVQLRRIINGDK